MTAFEVEQPILNSPFEEPAEHWRIQEGEAPKREKGRRPAGYFYRDPKAPEPAPGQPGIYWLFGAFIQARYSGSTETVLGQDLVAIRSEDPVVKLFRNLRLFGQRLVVTPESLAGRTDRSPYFLLSYLAA